MATQQRRQNLDFDSQLKSIQNEEIEKHVKQKKKQQQKTEKKKQNFALEVKLKDQLDMEKQNVKIVQQKLIEMQNQIDLKVQQK